MLENEDVEPFRHEPGHRGRRIRLLAGIVAAAGLLILGAIGGALLNERRQAGPTAVAPAPPAGKTVDASPGTGHTHGTGTAATTTASSEPLEVTLTPEALQRAGIKIVTVSAAATGGALTAPGTVTSNAYRDTKVNALVGGIVRQVTAELGSAVDRGQPLAVIFSSELADAQTKYLSMRASLDADHQKLERTRRLTDLGAASRQELEEVTAVHHAHESELEAARQRLILLGLSGERVAKLDTASQVIAEVIVTSPTQGVVITRSVNPGQVVGAAQELFVVTDLATVWVIGDLYEKDFGSVRIGTPASVIVSSAASRPIQARVAYVDPRVDAATRTAKIRVEVPNRDQALKLGMFVEVTFATGMGARRTIVPRTAVQSIGGHSVVYVATDDEGRFVERRVKLGSVVGDAIEIVGGVKAGERVAADGSFFLRAEASRARGG